VPENNGTRNTGPEFDEALTCNHYRARMYDAGAGRFAPENPDLGMWMVISFLSSIFLGLAAGSDPWAYNRLGGEMIGGEGMASAKECGGVFKFPAFPGSIGVEIPEEPMPLPVIT